MKELSAVEVEEISGGLVWAIVFTFGGSYALGYAKGTYDKWRDSLNEPVIDGWARAG